MCGWMRLSATWAASRIFATRPSPLPPLPQGRGNQTPSPLGRPDFDAFWNKDSKTELYHFIGKDILYFHALFWPAMLKAADYRTPTKISAHGFLTVDGQKMSKSRGTFITAESYLQQGLNPEWLRYYFAAKLNGTMEDIDLSFDDFVARVNSDLIGKYINIASRCAGFITKRFGGKLAELPEEERQWYAENILESNQPFETDHSGNPYRGDMEAAAKVIGDELFSEIEIKQVTVKYIAACYEEREYNSALRKIMAISDLANQYVNDNKPWELAKQREKETRLHEVCTMGIALFRALSIFLKPVLPRLAEKVEQFLNVTSFSWNDVEHFLPAGHVINEYQHLMTRIDPKQIEALIAANRESLITPLPAGEGQGVRAKTTKGAPHKPNLPPTLIQRARDLRKTQTDAETLLWSLLRDRQIADAKFRRQHPVDCADVGRFVLDFYCSELKLAVELDGGQHAEQAAYDEKRSRVLAQHGIRVLRFWNNEVLDQTEAVMEFIWQALQPEAALTPAPSPAGRGESHSQQRRGEHQAHTEKKMEIAPVITIDDFNKIDLRIARIVNAEHVEGAEKLLKLTLDVGEENPRTVFSGIKPAYEPEQLKDRLTVVVANLAPRKMRFGVSEGMVLAAGPGGKDLWLIQPDSGAQPGMRIK